MPFAYVEAVSLTFAYENEITAVNSQQECLAALWTDTIRDLSVNNLFKIWTELHPDNPKH